MSDSREHALQKQLLKAKDLIRQFGDGSGRHNSNLAAAGRDRVAGVELSLEQLLAAQEYALRLIARHEHEAWFDEWTEYRVKPQDALENHLLQRGLLRARPQDCQIGQIVRIEAIENPGRWARVRGDYEHELRDNFGWGTGVAINHFEFERTRYFRRIGPTPKNPTEPQNVIEREFWKRVA